VQESVRFMRRLGPGPVAGHCAAAVGCPDVWELETGDFAVIGVRASTQIKAKLPSSAGCGPDEELVVIPRALLVGAKRDIPAE